MENNYLKINLFDFFYSFMCEEMIIENLKGLVRKL